MLCYSPSSRARKGFDAGQLGSTIGFFPFLGSDLFARHLARARAASPRTEDQASGRRARGGEGPAESGNRVHEETIFWNWIHEETISWTFLGMGGALRLLLLSDVFLLLLLPKTELASYQTSIAEEEIPEERAGDEEEPGEQKFPSPCKFLKKISD